MAKQALPFKRLNAFSAPPEDLIIVGLDTDDGPEHALYDERIHDDIEDSFIRNIDYHGVLEDVLVLSDGDRVLVVAGRRRVRAARAANVLRHARGEAPLRVRVTVKKGDDKTLRSIVVSENEQRRADTPLTRAKKAQRMVDIGMPLEDIALAFGVGKPTVDRWLCLLDLAKPVQDAVEGGRVSATAAAKLASLPRKEQVAELPGLLEGKATVADVERRVRKKKGKPSKTSETTRDPFQVIADAAATGFGCRLHPNEVKLVAAQLAAGRKALDGEG